MLYYYILIIRFNIIINNIYIIFSNLHLYISYIFYFTFYLVYVYIVSYQTVQDNLTPIKAFDVHVPLLCQRTRS